MRRLRVITIELLESTEEVTNHSNYNIRLKNLKAVKEQTRKRFYYDKENKLGTTSNISDLKFIFNEEIANDLKRRLG